jgi:hypothetical protein
MSGNERTAFSKSLVAAEHDIAIAAITNWIIGGALALKRALLWARVMRRQFREPGISGQARGGRPLMGTKRVRIAISSKAG